MNRRSMLKSLVVWVGTVAAVALGAQQAHAYYFFYEYRFSYFAHRNRRRSRWRNR